MAHLWYFFWISVGFTARSIFWNQNLTMFVCVFVKKSDVWWINPPFFPPFSWDPPIIWPLAIPRCSQGEDSGPRRGLSCWLLLLLVLLMMMMTTTTTTTMMMIASNSFTCQKIALVLKDSWFQAMSSSFDIDWLDVGHESCLATWVPQFPGMVNICRVGDFSHCQNRWLRTFSLMLGWCLQFT